MTTILPSYVQGAWWTPADVSAAQASAAVVRDASTGDVVTHGTGSSKKQAEMAAALTAWRELNARA